jgi:thiamine biosynthesis lipoprotein
MSEGFARVMQFSLQLAEQTQGAFDPTVEPLVNLWGFGPDGRRLSPPSPDEIAHMQKKVGYRQLSMPTIRTVIKQHPEVQLDFGAVAKGYAVDEVTHLLYRMDYQDMLVEIGGEVRAEGVNMEKNPWRIGIQKPHFGALPGQELEGIVSLSGWAMATSGDYQNFYEDKQGRVYAHIIDPRNGFPAGHSLASVTVICRNCMMADGLATALYVMGPQEGLAFINNWKDAEALFVERQQDGTFSHRMSTGFKDVTNFK